jgi:pSer/pThr/pTyr-binding forkhead associated (FHA) protein
VTLMPPRDPTYGQSAAELKRQIEMERKGGTFLVHRESDERQRITRLGDRERVTIGRDAENDIALNDDEQVSRVHAELQLIGGSWVVSDQGLSTNGTFVNDRRVTARVRLEDRDLIGIGSTGLLFREPPTGNRVGPTVAADATAAAQALTETQRRVLVELCRPFGSGDSFATPATNRQIAEGVHLSVDAVKGHLRVLFERFDLSELPQNEKRARLAEQALRSGAVRPSDLT